MSAVAQKKRKTILGPELNGTLMTPEELDAVEEYDDNYIYELIHGVLVVNPIPLESEVGPNEYVGHLLLAYWERDVAHSALDATLPERYIRTKDSRRRADRLIWAGLGRMPDWKKDLPSIAVEFVSRARRDRLRDYEEKQREIHGAGHRRVLDHRSLPSNHDRDSQGAKRTGGSDRSRTGGLLQLFIAWL